MRAITAYLSELLTAIRRMSSPREHISVFNITEDSTVSEMLPEIMQRARHGATVHVKIDQDLYGGKEFIEAEIESQLLRQITLGNFTAVDMSRVVCI